MDNSAADAQRQLRRGDFSPLSQRAAFHACREAGSALERLRRDRDGASK
jgi:hypothetical protein